MGQRVPPLQPIEMDDDEIKRFQEEWRAIERSVDGEHHSLVAEPIHVGRPETTGGKLMVMAIWLSGWAALAVWSYIAWEKWG